VVVVVGGAVVGGAVVRGAVVGGGVVGGRRVVGGLGWVVVGGRRVVPGLALVGGLTAPPWLVVRGGCRRGWVAAVVVLVPGLVVVGPPAVVGAGEVPATPAGPPAPVLVAGPRHPAVPHLEDGAARVL
jgi:hypothetical protein